MFPWIDKELIIFKNLRDYYYEISCSHVKLRALYGIPSEYNAAKRRKKNR